MITVVAESSTLSKTTDSFPSWTELTVLFEIGLFACLGKNMEKCFWFSFTIFVGFWGSCFTHESFGSNICDNIKYKLI